LLNHVPVAHLHRERQGLPSPTTFFTANAGLAVTHWSMSSGSQIPTEKTLLARFFNTRVQLPDYLM
jgi:hypothetical protein